MPNEVLLPPPIRDPISGKVYVAIKAPPFVIAQDGTGTELELEQIVPGYVYVERKEVAANRVFSKDRTSSAMVQRRSIGQWSSAAANSPPPPKHVPWEGSVTSASSSDSIPAQPSSRRESCDQSTSSIDLPSFESGFSLIRGRLPALSSVVDSESSANIPVPKFAEVSARRTLSYTLSGRSQSSDSRSTCRAQPCETMYPNNREAHVFRRRPELGSAEAHAQSTIQTPQFRSLRTRSYDKRLLENTTHPSPIPEESSVANGETPKAFSSAPNEHPSLVVSTSDYSTLVSLDSTRLAKTSTTKPLKIVNKKKSPPASLKLVKPKLQSADYPDVPTPFCASPRKGGNTDSYFAGSVYPRLHLDTKLSTEEMIESLMKQVENFKPIVTLPEATAAALALGYARLDNSSADTASVPLPQAPVGLGLNVLQKEPIDTSISSTGAEASLDSDSTGYVPTADAQTVPTSPIKSSIWSGRSRSGTSSSSGSERRVRFNSGLNQRISAVILHKEEPVSLLQMSPPRSPVSRIQKPKTSGYSTASSPVTSPKRSTQTSSSPRNRGNPMQSPQQFRTMQYQKRLSKNRLSLASAGLMDVKPVPAAEGAKVSHSENGATSGIPPVSLPFSTLPRAVPNFTPSPLFPRRRMTDTLPSPSTVTPRTFGFGSGAAIVTPTPASSSNAGAGRRMTLSSAPRMRSFTVGAARGKENREIVQFRVKENRENVKEKRPNEALSAKKRNDVDENVARECEKGLKKVYPFQGMLNRLKA